MRVSQLIHAMHRDDEIRIDDFNKPVDKMTIYKGTARGIYKDDPINKMHILSVAAAENIICVLAIEQRKELAHNEKQRTN